MSRRPLAASAALIALALPILPEVAAAEPVTFTNWFYDGELKEAFEAYNESFVAAGGADAVQVETIPFPRYHDVLSVRAASGSPPDAAFLFAGMGPAWLASGRLMDLTPFIEASPDWNIEDFGEAIDPWVVDGRVMGIPFTNATNVVYYNTDLFAAAGLPTPAEREANGEWTWENLRATAEALQTDGGARYGYVFGNGIFTVGWQNLVDLLPAYGGAPWSADGVECGFDDPGTVQAMQLVHDMIYVDGSHPEPGVDVDFAAGDIGMSLTRPNFAFRLAEVPFGWDIIRAPDGPEGYVPSRAQNVLVAFADAANPEGGAAYVVHATAPAQAALWTASAPPRLSLQSLEQMLPNNSLSQEQMDRSLMPAMQSERYQLEYAHPNYGPLQSEVQRLFGANVWLPDAVIPDAMALVCNSIAPFLVPAP
jgi:multiple sugar transport system substrate-binding protein